MEQIHAELIEFFRLQEKIYHLSSIQQLFPEHYLCVREGLSCSVVIAFLNLYNVQSLYEEDTDNIILQLTRQTTMSHCLSAVTRVQYSG